MNEITTAIHQARANAKIVARHYNLPAANLKIMLEDVKYAPISISKTYAAIVRSFEKENKHG